MASRFVLVQNAVLIFWFAIWLIKLATQSKVNSALRKPRMEVAGWIKHLRMAGVRPQPAGPESLTSSVVALSAT